MRTIVFALMEPWKHFQNQPESGEKQQVGYFEVPSIIPYLISKVYLTDRYLSLFVCLACSKRGIDLA